MRIENHDIVGANLYNIGNFLENDIEGKAKHNNKVKNSKCSIISLPGFNTENMTTKIRFKN